MGDLLIRQAAVTDTQMQWMQCGEHRCSGCNRWLRRGIAPLTAEDLGARTECDCRFVAFPICLILSYLPGTHLAALDARNLGPCAAYCHAQTGLLAYLVSFSFSLRRPISFIKKQTSRRSVPTIWVGAPRTAVSPANFVSTTYVFWMGLSQMPTQR